MREIERLGTQPRGEIVRIGLGVARPYLISHPDHIQYVLREKPDIYVRGGVFWSPLRRLFGDSVLSEGEIWRTSRRALQPVFTARHVASVATRIADTINEGVRGLDEAARTGRPIDAMTAMGNVVNRTVLGIFFGDKISKEETDVLVPAFETVATSLAYRFLLPFVPEAIRLPGDRAFRAAVRKIDEVMYGLARKHRDHADDDRDVFSMLCRARWADGGDLGDRWVRDNLVAIFATGTETTAGALTWLWPLLDAHPEVAARMRREIDEVVGPDGPSPEHLKHLTYTRQVTQELLRLYPVGWLFPRMAVRDDTIAGVTINAGESVLISPFITHRLATVWSDPHTFDPERFGTRRASDRHRYAYFPFGGGPHQCIGMHLFNSEALLIIAAMVRRFEVVLRAPVPAMPKVGASLRPRGGVELILRPRRPARAETARARTGRGATGRAETGGGRDVVGAGRDGSGPRR